MKDLSHYRDEFPVVERFIYLNHAAVSPLPLRSARAMEGLISDVTSGGITGYPGWIETCQGLRESTAKLISAEPEEIAVTKNTSEGLSFLANGIDWRPGDVVVAVRQDFPANVFPWKRLERRGVTVRWLELHGGRLELDEIDKACDGARLAAVSWAHYLSGFRLDLDAVGEICRRRDCLLAVDAVQALGPFPLDVKNAGVHFLSASGHKWLLGPEGCGFLYIEQSLQDQVEPAEFGWTNVSGFPSFSREEVLRPDAGRYECGTLNTVGCYGLRASIELFLEAGTENTSRQVDALAQRLYDGVIEKGYQPMAHRDNGSGSGIVTFRKPGVDSEQAARTLAGQGVSLAARHGWLRAAPHFYNTTDEIDRTLQLLA